MIKAELYHKTVGILFDAYFNDTLEHCNCRKCAVGNLIAGNLECDFQTFEGLENSPIYMVSGKAVHVPWLSYDSHFSCTDRRSVNKLTGYSNKELLRIENAFEDCDGGENKEDYMFNGLVAVLNVLKEIHEVTDQDLLTTNNNRFKEQYERRAAKIVL